MTTTAGRGTDMDDKRTALLRLLRDARADDARGADTPSRPRPATGIAVIGLAGRYPRAATPDELWARARDGEHCIGEFPAERSPDGRSSDGRSPDGRPDTRRWAGLIDDADAFDPLFFGIAPVDADSIDPQERVFLETVWAALEDAGHPPRRLARENNPVGVFAGVMNSDYEWMAGEATALGAPNAARSSHWSIANRVSYVLDFRGPSLTVNTACSASLTAVHLACESLRSGECEVAVAGGVNLILHESHLRTLADNGMTSPGDTCRSFGRGADGFVDGEGVGAVILKPLDRAVADGDRVYGVIRSSAVNSGGKTGGYTVPSPQAQAEVIRASLRRAAIDPRTIGCVEAHGTGTPLGDPIEIAGLREAFAERVDDTLVQGVARCAVGSVKSNIGHLESAAGVAGLTKMLMQIGHGTVAPSLHSGELNPDIDLDGTPFFVPQEAVAWERPVVVHADGRRVELPRRGAVSSFGGGGANAHVIVEEYVAEDAAEGAVPVTAAPGPRLVVLSARDEERLRVYAGRLAGFLDGAGEDQDASEAEATCLRLAAEVLGVSPDDLDPLTPLHEYGCGAPELSRLVEKLDAEFGRDVHLTGADTLRDLVPQPSTAPTVTLADLAHTLQAGREELPARLAFPAGDVGEARALLHAYAAGEAVAEIVTGVAPGHRVAADDGLGRALEQGELRAVAEQWVRGVEVDWSRLPGSGARRVGLPTYPFARKRYWLPRPTLAVAATPVADRRVEPTSAPEPALGSAPELAPRPAPAPTPGMSFYRPTWLPEPRPATTPDPTPRSVLILTTRDAAPLADGIAHHHRHDTTHLVDLDHDDLAHALTTAGHVDRVYHLGGIRPSDEPDNPGDLTTSHRRGAQALFTTARHLAPRRTRLHLTVVTNDASAAFGDPVANPFAAGLHGLTRVLVKEHPEIRAVCLDFTHAEPTRDDLLTAVLEEPGDATGRTVLLRHGVRYVPALQPVELPAPEKAPYREGGVYVIVGGAGGIGRELTLHLAERHRAKVVWISRGALDPEQRACAERARALGGEVLHLRADCRDPEALTRAARQVKAEYGAIHGVVHAAMTFDPGPLAALDEETFTASLAVKTEGSVATDRAFGGEPLDFLAFFSSVGALVGTAGNGTYSCAGAVQDAYALHLDHRRPYPVRVIDWGYWGPVGSGARPGLREMFQDLGIGELTVPDGLSAIARTLGGRLPQVLPIHADDATLTALGAALAPAARQSGADAPATLRTAAVRLLRPRTDDAPGVLSVIAGYERLTEVCRPAVLAVLQGMGVLTGPGESHDRDELADRLGILPKFRRLYEALLNILKDDGHVEFDGNRVRSTGEARQLDALEPEFDRIAADHPDLAPTVTLTRLFLRAYAEILRGDIRATEIMFPGSSMALVADFYKANPLTDSFNELVRDAVAVHLEHRIAALAPGERLRIVEFGAGTGATTDAVLPVLAPYADRVSYWFTDISQHFLDHAEARLRPRYDAPGFLNFRVLDLERGHEEQGFDPGTYDMVLATNVVHATADLRATLGKAKDLLRTGGWLVLNELTEVRDSTTVVGGVLDGWWLFDDGELRLPDSPLVHPDTWRRLLREQGFGDVTVTGGTGADGRARGQHVIVGESDGLRPVAPRTTAADAAETPAAVRSAPSGALQHRLAAIVARCLKLDEDVDPDRPLASYGFDSLTGMKIVAGIADEFGVTVSLGDFYDHPTLRELAEYYAESGTFGVSAAPVAPPVVAVADGPATDHPLSEGQRALWVIERMNPGTYAYNLPLAFRLDPGTDIAALRLALQSIVDRHDSLRSTIRTTGEGPVRTVAAWQELHFQQRYLAVTDEPAVRDRVREEARRPFDLEHGPLLRVTLFTQGDGGHVLLLAFHHIVFDGVSIAAFLRELTTGYQESRAGRRPDTTPAEATFADFTAWQRDLLAGPEGDRLRAYWLRRLDTGPDPLALPYDRPRPQVPGHRGAAVEGRMDAELVGLARRFAAEKRTSLFAVLLSGYFTLLQRYTQQRGIRVGTPAAGRPSTRFEDSLGYFMNMVVLQADVDPGQDFGTLSGQVHRTVLEALEHAHLPLITLTEALRQAGRTDTADLFRTAFYFQNWVEPGDRDPVREVFHGVHQEGEFDVTLEVVEGAADCAYTLKYDPDLFDEDTVRRLGDHFLALLRAALTEPARPVGRLPLLTGDERRRIEERWQQARRPYSGERTLPDLVEEQAARRPDALAVTSDLDPLTYRQLVDRIDALAGRLRAEGVRPGRAVGVLVERGHLPVALLAVLKAGGSYVPLDPTYPVDRLGYMAEDAGLHLVLTTGTAENALGDLAVPRLRLDRPDGPTVPDGPSARPDDTAYIIYTSGSTGRPKGVAVPHRALVNFLTSMKDEPGFGENDTLLALTTVCFDIAALELYLPLITGGRVDIAPADVAKDGVKLRRHLETRGATVVQATPSTWKMLLATGWPGDPALTALCGGEALDQDTADALTARTRTAWNLYGPTETTIWSAVARLTPGTPVHLGRAVANTQLLVLDAHGQQVPPGVPGELHIGGDGLATGYVGRPDLTAERFVPNPVAPDLSPRLYRTGDLVRALPDGTLVYLGRADTQVKVRGHRVETGEVEAAMRRLAGVTEAVVVPAPAAGGGGVMLRGFYTGTGEPVDPAPLGAWLPAYMVPDVLVPLREFPQTLNAKTDRVRLGSAPLDELRAAHGDTVVRETRRSADPLADELARLVAEVAEVAEERVPRDRPLGELGLNSVGFTTLSTRIGQAFGVEVYPTAFYQYPTVTGMAGHLLHAHPELRARFGAGTATAVSAKAEPARPDADTGIAVVGMAGRLPRSPDLDAFWQHLADGDDLIQEIPADRWDWREVSSRSHWGGFVPEVDRFDAAFFGISPREAELMDPQQRLVLETVWTALEDAGIRPSELAGRRVGVFLGVTNSDYLEVQRAAGQDTDAHTITGAALSVIPNRVSYLLDLRGPSLALDTACSSSLTAIHQAVSALRDGSCDLAIAGGVSLILDPALYVALSKNEMLSEDGRCKAFDSRANGYVRGEGVGAVVLKALDAAERDGDPVHAVIRGTAVNHGGRTNSLTAPSPDAQAEVVARAHRAAGTDPASVGYIEAHGTGTALGDPIEVTGLRTAFTRLYEEAGRPMPAEPAIGLGSVKSNVGHLEAAAGMAGLFKVVLAMRHATIPASLHVVEENRYLDLDGGPFRIVTEPTPWERAGTLPRRAGLSSFGFGGAGAHLVLEEAPDHAEPAPRDEHGPELLVVSARSRSALTAYAGRLAAHLREGRTALADVAHTLRVARDPMPHRLAFVAADRRQAVDALDAFAAGEQPPGVHSGRTGKGRPHSASWQRYLDALITDRALPELAELWVSGEEFDWRGLAGEARRVRVPTYPFDRTRHWVAAPATVAHPLLDTTGPGESTKRLTGEEFYLRDHVSDGTPILPGVVLLEMARAADHLTRGDGRSADRIEDVTWAAPVHTGAGEVTVRIRLDRQPGRTGFEVLTSGGRPHATGTIVAAATGDRRTLDLAALKDRCSQRTSGADYYRRVDATGFHYGPSFQAVTWLASGDREALARLETPAHLRAGAGAYRFHPALMDAALQTAGSIASGDDPAAPAHLPYSVGVVELVAERLPDTCHAYARRTDDGATAGVKVFDILLTDDDGVVVARIERFTLRALPSGKGADDPLVAFEPYRRESESPERAPLPRTLVLLDGARSGIGAGLAERTGARVVTLEPGAEIPDGLAGPVAIVHLPGAGDGFHTALALCRSWIARSAGETRYLYVHPEDAPEHAAVGGLARAVRAEYPGLRITAVACPDRADPTAVVAAELACAQAPAEVHTDGVRRRVGAWRPATLPDPAATSPFAAPGAHIITGGTGGIGLHLTERLAAHGADIVLASRSGPSPETVDRIARLAGTGARVLHVTADVTRREDVAALVRAAREHSGRIAGVLHAAGVLRDGFVLRKTRAEADAVLAPKVLGARWLDEETRDEPLAYFAAFSSTAAALGSVGQADYAYANAYLDHFVLRRARLREQGARSGHSLAVNWPLWRDGGMTMDAAAQEAMRRELGFGPLPTGVALDGLERALAGTAPRLLLATGDAGLIQRALDAEHAVTRTVKERADVDRAAVELFLRQLLSAELKMPVEDIDADEQFDRYGIDSLLVLSLTRELERNFGELSKTLFFEYFTVAELAGYFMAEHGPKLAELVGAAPEEVQPAVPVAVVDRPIPQLPVADDDIAVIGVSGRYPGADDLRAFWRNLREGVDSVGEIPADRWDHTRWFDPDREATGKSYSKWGGFLRDVDRFDPLFFRMSQVEAEHIDPQERIFLETVWHLLEDAGITRETLAGSRTGVFVGMMYGHYQLYGVEEALRGEGAATSSSYASVANRVSYFFDLDGPSVGLDTMCSSSLTAIHLAAQAIRAGDCDTAVAGGVNISSHPLKYLQLSRGGFLSTDGRCRSFGADGDGYVPAEGSGAVLLKRRSAAERDGDRILAVVKASAVNHGGAGKGFSVPNARAQGDLIATALERAGWTAADLDYIEAHGTGTSLGDPIEVTGLLRAFGGQDLGGRKIPIGSVKSNIGHAESAAGMAAVTKVLLQLRHGQLAPSLHADTLNPHIDFASAPLRVQRELADWTPRTDTAGRPLPRTAAVSAFGAGGSNAHVLLEEHMPAHPPVPSRARTPYVCVLSARDAAQLTAYAADLAGFLRADGEDTHPASLAHTLQTGREAMPHRLAVTYDTPTELLARLDAFANGATGLPDTWTGVVRRPTRTTATTSDPRALAAAWTSGETVDWHTLYEVLPPRVELPGYPFAGERCWYGPAGTPPPVTVHEELTLTATTPVIAGHRVAGRLLLPALAYIDLVHQAFRKHGLSYDSLELRDLTVLRPLAVTPEAPVRITLDGDRTAPDHWTIRITGQDGQPYATAELIATDPISFSTPKLPAVPSPSAVAEDLGAVYDRDGDVGQVYSGAVRAGGRVWRDAEQVIAELVPPPGAESSGHLFHPGLMLGGAVAAGVLLADVAGDEGAFFLPMHVESFRAVAPLNSACTARVARRSVGRRDEIARLTVEFLDADGRMIAELRGMASKLIRSQAPRATTAPAGGSLTSTEDRVRRLIADALNRDAGELDPAVGYYELGIDSVNVLELVGKLERDLGKSLPPTLLFEYTTIRDLAAYLDEHHPAAPAPAAVHLPPGARLLTKGWEPAPGTIGQLPGPVAVLADSGTRTLADRLARELPDAEVVTDLTERPDRYRACVDLTGCAPDAPGAHPGLHDWLPWVQHLVARASAAEPVLLLGVTRGLEDARPAGLAGADRAGLYRMLQSEYTNIRSRHVDLGPLDDDPAAVRQLVAELADTGEESEVRHRAGQRQRAVLRENPGTGGPPPFAGDFAPDEALWITGGTGGLGLAFARHAVRHWGVRRLVLAGRSPLPDRAAWETLRDDDARLDALLGLERAGAEVRVVSVPLGGPTPGQVAREVRESGKVGGVIHCAGVADRENLAFVGKPGDAVRGVLGPKVDGLDALVDAFAGHPLRFFALCSSVAAAVPSAAVGQSDYALANAYQDYVAAARPHGLPLLSVQWPSWSGVGMGDESPGPGYLRTGLGSVTEAEGTALLDHLLRSGAGPVVLPAVIHDAEWSPGPLTGRRISAGRGEVAVRKVADAGEPARIAGEAAEAAASWLLGLIAEQLHFDAGKLAADVPIEDFGTDSIVMVQLLRKVGNRLGVEPDPTAFIEHPTVEGFVGWLARAHPAEFAAAFGGTAVNGQGECAGGGETAGTPPAGAPSTDTRLGTDASPDRRAATASAFASARRPAEDAGDAGDAESAGDAVLPPHVRPHDIAVIGMSGRFPGAPDLDAYWTLLREGRSAIAPVPPERWGGDGNLVAGLVDRDGFDPAYFLLSDEDAEAMDPQALVLLEETLFALADAGYAAGDVKGQDVGVYVGARSRHLPDDETLGRTRNPIVAVGQNYLAANVSRFFDLRGPSVVVDTACSSALVALHSAAQALRDGDARAAVVGGITLLADDAGHRLFGQRGVLSPEPAFHAFDRRARGTVLAEGAGVVVLKPLERALADGDRVQAVLTGTAVNNDGRTAGPASPNPVAQRAVMAKALARSGRRPEEVTHIETNAAGSAVHDLVELKAIQAVYRDGSQVACSLGSVKPNIGHPQCAEGIAGLIKVVLMLRERQLVPFLSGQEPPEHFDLAATPFTFTREATPWPDAPLVAAVSCFADGGTNAHAVVEGWRGTTGGRAALERPALARRTLSPAVPARTGGTPVAVIGIAGRYPGADDVTAFWRNLVAGHDAVTEIPADRWEWRDEPESSRWGGFVADADRFDAEFFRVPRAEAQITDPQERLFLQTCWEAIEDAGYTPATLAAPRGPERRRAVGVFAGAMHKDYALIGAQAEPVDGKPLPVGLNQGMIANRVSFFCDFHGPSMAVDSLCSASLTTVHLAVESIARGESEVALAGGVNLSLHPAKYRTYGAVDMHSATGRSRSFGADADGWVSSEGVGAVVLKPLDAAERDGDHVYAVIRSTAVGHVGTGSAVTVPNPVAQAAVVTEALEKAGVDARTIGALEAHGTGTRLGDPIELQGLARAFRRHTDDTGFCALGSVKSNIGHAESAGGVAGLTKAVLQLHHRTLVPSLHSGTANPLLGLADTPFRLQHEVQAWPEGETPRRAGISSYGATGSHAHVVLEEYTSAERPTPTGPQIVPLSARDGDRLREAAERLLAFLDGEPAASLAELAHTLQTGRVAMASRVAFVVEDTGELRRALEKHLAGPAVNPWATPAEDVEPWYTERRLTELADHWAAGGDLDWRRLWPGTRPRRVPLPTYPFARDRHWHPGADGGR